MKKDRQKRSFWSKCGGVRPWRICSRLPLTSELDALCAEHANSIALTHKWSSHRTHWQKRKRSPQGQPLSLFWSKCGDSNSRPPVPEESRSSLLTTFVCFSVLLSPKAMLSDALVRTVSTQSKSVDGQRCGHRPFSTR